VFALCGGSVFNKEKLGREMNVNKIYNEDCLDTMKSMPENFIDLTVTSPPYDNLRDYNGYKFDFESIAQSLYRVTKSGGVVVWVVGDSTVNGSESGTSFKQALYFKEIGFNLHDTMIYRAKKAPLTHKRYEQEFEYMFVLTKGPLKTFNGIMETKLYPDARTNKQFRREKDGSHDYGYCSTSDKRLRYNIWEYFTGKGKDDEIAFKHPAIFPERLAADHIYSWSNEGDLVYDPFGGSATTAKMAHLLNRKWILSEISAEYCEIGNKRLKPYLAQTSLFYDQAGGDFSLLKTGT
jgi:DNA modification methylase